MSPLSFLTNDGLIVCIEGDRALYYDNLQTALEKYKKFTMLNNIYKETNKLATLKNKRIDVLILQTTGIRKKEIEELQRSYNYARRVDRYR